MNYFVYHKTTSEIIATVSCPSSMLALNVSEGCSAVLAEDGADDSTHWVEHETGIVRPKGDYPLEALPLPCTVTIEDVDYHCTEQPEFEFDAPGTYTLAVDAGPRYLKKEFTLENPA